MRSRQIYLNKNLILSSLVAIGSLVACDTGTKEEKGDSVSLSGIYKTEKRDTLAYFEWEFGLNEEFKWRLITPDCISLEKKSNYKIVKDTLILYQVKTRSLINGECDSTLGEFQNTDDEKYYVETKNESEFYASPVISWNGGIAEWFRFAK